MKLEYLYYFCEIAKAGSINAVTEQLNMSHQGLRHALQSLEEELGTELYQTNAHGLILLPAGELFFEMATDLLSRYKKFLADLEGIQQPTIEGTITLSLTSGLLDTQLREIFQDFTSTYPYINLSIVDQEHVDILQALQEHSIDLGIFGIQEAIVEKIFPEFYNNSSLSFTPLYQHKLLLLASSKHPIAKYKSISIKTLLKYDLIIATDHSLSKNTTYRWLKLYGEPTIKFMSAHSSIYYDLIKSGKVLGLTTSTSAYFGHLGNMNPEEFCYIPIREKESLVTVGYIYNKDEKISPAIQLFLNTLKSYSKNFYRNS
mgnify:CR=1 FL=1